MKDPEKEEITVNDKRRFNPDGSEKSDVSASETPPNPDHESPSDFNPDFTQANFANFILSLAGSVQMSLGLAPNPFTGKAEKNLDQAKHSLDLLGILQDKTKNNLTPEEDQLLRVILTDLRLRYVEEKKK